MEIERVRERTIVRQSHHSALTHLASTRTTVSLLLSSIAKPEVGCAAARCDCNRRI